jgi:hypothetical protein
MSWDWLFGVDKSRPDCGQGQELGCEARGLLASIMIPFSFFILFIYLLIEFLSFFDSLLFALFMSSVTQWSLKIFCIYFYFGMSISIFVYFKKRHRVSLCCLGWAQTPALLETLCPASWVAGVPATPPCLASKDHILRFLLIFFFFGVGILNLSMDEHTFFHWVIPLLLCDDSVSPVEV